MCPCRHKGLISGHQPAISACCPWRMFSMPHLLLVDDDEDILSVLTRFFQKHSHTVAVAQNGAAMSAALEKEPVDLVILDVMLHAEDGFTLCRRLRAASPVPIIMLTAMTDHTDRVVGLEIGADDYLTKPVDQRELLARVKAGLRPTPEKAAAPPRSGNRPGQCCAAHGLAWRRRR